MKYASFWGRFYAGLVDFLILLPFLFVYICLLSFSKEVGTIVVLAMFLLYSGYNVFCHAKWGQTAGKWLVGIKVTKLDGTAIGWREAIMRSSVLIIMRIIAAIGEIYGLTQIPDDMFVAVQNEGFFSEAYNEFAIAFTSIKPVPGWYTLLEQGWIGSELITMLFDKQRRALHDYLAGTIVIRK